MAIAVIETKGGKVIHLPPKGKYLNPVELTFNDLKIHYIRPQFSENGENLSQRKLKAIIKAYMKNFLCELSAFWFTPATMKLSIITNCESIL